jgi:hypothetical protein
MNLLAGAKREAAISRAQGAIDRSTSQYYGEKGDRGDAMGRMFAQMAERHGSTVEAMLTARAREARGMSGQEQEDRLKASIAEASRVAPELTAGYQSSPSAVAWGEAKRQEFQPGLNAAIEAAMVEANRRGLSSYDMGNLRTMGLDQAALGREATEAGMVSSVGNAELDAKYGAQMRQLNTNLNNAGQAGGNLALAGGVLQQAGLLGMSIGAMGRPTQGAMAPAVQETLNQGTGAAMTAPFTSPDQIGSYGFFRR